MKSLIAIPFLLVALSAGALASEHASISGKVVKVADGDTITILDGENKQHRIRFWGIDAPEHGQAFGTKAKDALVEKIFEQAVQVEVHDTDRYGRTVGVVMLGKRNINREMVAEGWGWWYQHYAPEAADLKEAEATARAAKLGLWKDPAPEAPWEFRKHARERSKKKPAASNM